jgi:hypothetical protein
MGTPGSVLGVAFYNDRIFVQGICEREGGF